MSQLALFDLPTAPPAPARRNRSVKQARKEDISSTPAAWRVGMLANLPIVAAIQGERWAQYTMRLSGRIEAINGELAEVRIDSPGHKFDGRMAVAHVAGLSANN